MLHVHSVQWNAGIGNTDTLHPNSCVCSFSIPTSEIFLNKIFVTIHVSIGYRMAASDARNAMLYPICCMVLPVLALCPSSLSSLMMGEIDLLVSQIPDSVFFRVLDLASRAIILSRPRHCSSVLPRSVCILV